jgi:hypothetical protein
MQDVLHAFNTLGTRGRFIAIGLLCLIAALAAVVLMDFVGMTQAWLGALFVAASGGVLGYTVARFGMRIHLSDFSLDQRIEVGGTYAVYIVGFAIAVAIAF